MSANYRVDIAIGPTTGGTTYSWSIERGDPPALPEILDGLTFGYAFPESNLWPVQPEPISVALSVLAESASDLTGIDRGTPIFVRVFAGLVVGATEFESITFTGRVSDAVGRPIRFGHPDTGDEVNGWLLQLQCVDTVPDLAEHTVAGYYALQGAGVRSHVNGRFALAGVTPPDWGNGGSGSPLVILNDGLIEPTDLASAVDTLLANYADGGVILPLGDPEDPYQHHLWSTEGWRRGIVRPNVDVDGIVDPAEPFRIVWVSRRYDRDDDLNTPAAPAVFALLSGGLYGLKLEPPPASIVIGGTTYDAHDGSIVIDADYLDYDATWTRTKFDDPNTVEVANNAPIEEQGLDPWSKVTATNRLVDEAVVSATLTDSLAYEAYDAASVAEMYLDDSANADVVWSASGFKWYASRDPRWPIHRSLFPESRTFREYSAPIIITGIPDDQRPDSRPWYVGVPRAVTWTFERGDFTISFDLYPRTPKPVGMAGLSWADLSTDFPAVDWTDLDPAFCWLDYRLARSAIYYP